MPKYLPRSNKKHYRKPKFGWGPPSFNPGKRSSAWGRHRPRRAFTRGAFRAFSNAKLEKTASFLEGGGVIGKTIARIVRLLKRKEFERKRPPKLEKDYTVETG